MRRNWILAGALLVLLIAAVSFAGLASKGTTTTTTTATTTVTTPANTSTPAPKVITVTSTGAVKANEGDVISAEVGVGVTVPSAKSTRCAFVERTATATSNQSTRLCVQRTATGVTWVRFHQEDVAGTPGGVCGDTVVAGCLKAVTGAKTDDAFTFLNPTPYTPALPKVKATDGRLYGDFTWWSSFTGSKSNFKCTGPTPDKCLDKGVAITMFKRSIQNWATPKAGPEGVVSTDKPRLLVTYAGESTKVPVPKRLGKLACDDDGSSVVGWADLSLLKNAITMTCVNYTGNVITESDVALASTGCCWDPQALEDVLTRERGKQLGLADPMAWTTSTTAAIGTPCYGGYFKMNECAIASQVHPDLTMGDCGKLSWGGLGQFCDRSSLALGDIRGITALYGTK